jgi:hypothetical protein
LLIGIELLLDRSFLALNKWHRVADEAYTKFELLVFGGWAWLGLLLAKILCIF